MLPFALPACLRACLPTAWVIDAFPGVPRGWGVGVCDCPLPLPPSGEIEAAAARGQVGCRRKHSVKATGRICPETPRCWGRGA